MVWSGDSMTKSRAGYRDARVTVAMFKNDTVKITSRWGARCILHAQKQVSPHETYSFNTPTNSSRASQGATEMNFLLLSLFVATCSALSHLSRGHVIVHKGLTAPQTKDYLVLGSNFTVTYTVINIGQG